MGTLATNIGGNELFLSLFILIAAFNLVTFLLGCYLDAGLYNKVIFGPSCQFGDYFLHVSFVSQHENLYSLSRDACFPPLAYCMYWLLWKLAPHQINGVVSSASWPQFAAANNAMTIFLICNLIQLILLVYCVYQYFQRGDAKHLLLFPVLLVCSYPFWGTSLQRGNSTALVAIILALAFYLADNSSTLKRKLAMLLIAVAAGFKNHPAICGLIYVKHWQPKACVRLLLYGLLLYFVPFIFFGGVTWLQTLFEYYQNWALHAHHLGTVRGMTQYLLSNVLGVSGPAVWNISVVMEFLFLVLSIGCFFLAKTKCRVSYF